jgi:Putative binding domain, N-terminal
VTATPTQCSWKASTTDTWITLLPVSPSFPAVQPYSVAANPNPGSRTGSISIQGEMVTITQAGQQTCTYGITPGSTIFDVGGGIFTVNVTAPAGCAWTAVSDSTTWLTVSGSASGSGNGSFTLQAASNTGGLRSATVTVGDKTFKASQSASACGATDVSSQVTVTRGALLLQPFKFPASYSQQVRLTNTGSAVAGPVYVVFDGLCPGGFPSSCPLSSYQLTTCQTPPSSAVGSPMVLATAGGLAPGQILNILLTFSANPYVNGVTSSTVTTRVLSGTPSQ